VENLQSTTTKHWVKSILSSDVSLLVTMLFAFACLPHGETGVGMSLCKNSFIDVEM